MISIIILERIREIESSLKGVQGGEWIWGVGGIDKNQSKMAEDAVL